MRNWTCTGQSSPNGNQLKGGWVWLQAASRSPQAPSLPHDSPRHEQAAAQALLALQVTGRNPLAGGYGAAALAEIVQTLRALVRRAPSA